jgi:hypothetical protein
MSGDLFNEKGISKMTVDLSKVATNLQCAQVPAKWIGGIQQIARALDQAATVASTVGRATLDATNGADAMAQLATDHAIMKTSIMALVASYGITFQPPGQPIGQAAPITIADFPNEPDSGGDAPRK